MIGKYILISVGFRPSIWICRIGRVWVFGGIITFLLQGLQAKALVAFQV